MSPILTIKLGLVDVSDIFFFFSARGRGKGSPRHREGGTIFIENPRKGGVSRAGGGRGARGWEGVCGEFGKGGQIFFFGAEFPTKWGNFEIFDQKVATS